MTPSPYRKLTGKKRTITGHSQLWMGPDHLLLVRSMRIVEHYQRFAFRDIEAVVISDGPDMRAFQSIAVIASVGWGSLAAAVNSDFGRGFFIVTALLGLTLTVIDILRGPRCRCVLKTAVSVERLPSVSRRSIATVFLGAIAAAVENVQGSLSAEQLAGYTGAPIQAAPVVTPPEVTRGRTYVAEILFGLVLLDAVLVWFALRAPTTNAASLLPTVYLAELVLAIVTLIQRRGAGGILITLAAFSLALTVADIALVSGMAAFSTILNRAGGETRTLGSLWFSPEMTVAVASGWRVVMGMLGLAACYVDRRSSAK
jgi:hypothetical protein